MSLRIAKHVAGLFVVCSLIAWSSARAAGSEAACCALSGGCAGMTDQQILDKALNNSPGSTSSNFGSCYFHDRTNCPDCACKYYIKVSYYGGDKGFDGGTGCLDDIQQVIAHLRQLCEDGVCCCPKPAPTGACPVSQAVWAKDPLTGSCCAYANPCAAPSGWPLYPDQPACAGWKTSGVDE
jgi:hypothetical protein